MSLSFLSLLLYSWVIPTVLATSSLDLHLKGPIAACYELKTAMTPQQAIQVIHHLPTLSHLVQYNPALLNLPIIPKDSYDKDPDLDSFTQSLRGCLSILKFQLPQVPLYLEWRDEHLNSWYSPHLPKHIDDFYKVSKCIEAMLTSPNNVIIPCSSATITSPSMKESPRMHGSSRKRKFQGEDHALSSTYDASSSEYSPYTIRATLLALCYSLWKQKVTSNPSNQTPSSFKEIDGIQDQFIAFNYIHDMQKSRNIWAEKILFSDLLSSAFTPSLKPYLTLRLLDDSIQLLKQGRLLPAAYNFYKELVSDKKLTEFRGSTRMNLFYQIPKSFFSNYNQILSRAPTLSRIPPFHESPFFHELSLLARISNVEGGAVDEIHRPISPRPPVPSLHHPFNTLIASFPKVMRALFMAYGVAIPLNPHELPTEWHSVRYYLKDFVKAIRALPRSKDQTGVNDLEVCIRTIQSILFSSLGQDPVKEFKRIEEDLKFRAKKDIYKGGNADYLDTYIGFILLGFPTVPQGSPSPKNITSLYRVIFWLDYLLANSDFDSLYLRDLSSDIGPLTAISCRALDHLSSFNQHQMVKTGLTASFQWNTYGSMCSKGK
ncbi:MAG: hypothetical protein DHS80DRAFT_26081 [Piptocephalis tieghemiana]|nr:MAG: hypothetical protein DHS80DRAFT_26081 [Piptocephalis tieghemiana]